MAIPGPTNLKAARFEQAFGGLLQQGRGHATWLADSASRKALGQRRPAVWQTGSDEASSPLPAVGARANAACLAVNDSGPDRTDTPRFPGLRGQAAVRQIPVESRFDPGQRDPAATSGNPAQDIWQRRSSGHPPPSIGPRAFEDWRATVGLVASRPAATGSSAALRGLRGFHGFRNGGRDGPAPRAESPSAG